MKHEKTYVDAIKDIPKSRRQKNLKRIIKEQIATNKGYIFLMFLVAVITNAILVLQPRLTQHILDKALENSSDFWKHVTYVSISLGVFLILLVITSFISRYLFLKFEQKVEFDMRKKIFEKTMHVKTSSFDSNNEGYFMGLITRDPFFVSQMVHNVPKNLFSGLMLLSLTLSFVFTISWIAGVVGIAILILTATTSLTMKKKYNRQFARIKAVEDVYNKQITNDIVGIREIKKLCCLWSNF